MRSSHAWHVSTAMLVLAVLWPDIVSAQSREAAQVSSSTVEGVANLPYARGKTFRTLDDYLAHLEAQSAVDLPWWREIRPGVYERVTSMPEAPREVATRAELMRRFGFTR